MLVELWHHRLLLRPLLVFLLAGPLIVLAVLFRGRAESRGSQRRTDAADGTPERMCVGDPEPRVKLRVEVSPREWKVDGSGSDRRVA